MTSSSFILPLLCEIPAHTELLSLPSKSILPTKAGEARVQDQPELHSEILLKLLTLGVLVTCYVTVTKLLTPGC